MPTFSNIQEMISFFFDSPSTPLLSHRTNDFAYSVLYLLRRDIQEAFFYHLQPDPIIDDLSSNLRTRLTDPNFHLIWPATLTIFAGIDLLAKFYSGEDSARRVGPRLRDYLAAYAHELTQDQIDLIYSVRNSLVHSFGLYDRVNNRRIQIDALYNQSLSASVVDVNNNIYRLHFKHLYLIFLESINRYQSALVSNIDLQNSFQIIFTNYAYLFIS